MECLGQAIGLLGAETSWWQTGLGLHGGEVIGAILLVVGMRGPAIGALGWLPAAEGGTQKDMLAVVSGTFGSKKLGWPTTSSPCRRPGARRGTCMAIASCTHCS